MGGYKTHPYIGSSVVGAPLVVALARGCRAVGQFAKISQVDSYVRRDKSQSPRASCPTDKALAGRHVAWDGYTIYQEKITARCSATLITGKLGYF